MSICYYVKIKHSSHIITNRSIIETRIYREKNKTIIVCKQHRTSDILLFRARRLLYRVLTKHGINKTVISGNIQQLYR